MNQSSINNPQISEFLKPNSEEVRSKGEVLRLNATLHLQKIDQIWKIAQQDLLYYFQTYETMPYSKLTAQLLFGLERIKMVRTEHKLYFGQIFQKKKEGKGIAIYRNGKIYQGDFHLNQKSGYGVQVYANANVYVGDFSQNKKHGKGSFFWFNLCDTSEKQRQIEQYHGDWWGGLPDGMGEHLKANGDAYVGMFKNGLKHGQGTQMYANGDKYKGQFVNGLPQGFGEYTWIDGSFFKGDFKQGFRNGYGIWKSQSGTGQSYKGHYMLDKKHGYGIYNWGNGYVYKGFWLDDLRYGQGQLLFNDQVEYDGYWEKGQKVDYKPDMKEYKMNEVVSVDKTFLDTNKTLGSQSKVTEKFPNINLNPDKKRNFSAERKRERSSEFSVSFHKKQHSQQKQGHSGSRCGHKNCVPNIPIGKMPKPTWKNAWKK